MAIAGLHHLVLLVPDVPDGESYYRSLFDLDCLFREAHVGGDPGTVPDDCSWGDVIDAGATPTMSFLGRDEFTLAVAGGDGHDGTGRVDHVALAVDEEAFDGITASAREFGHEVVENAAHHRVFTDRYGVEWELNANPRPPSRTFEELDRS